jgi:hypothetical protein
VIGPQQGLTDQLREKRRDILIGTNSQCTGRSSNSTA